MSFCVLSSVFIFSSTQFCAFEILQLIKSPFCFSLHLVKAIFFGVHCQISFVSNHFNITSSCLFKFLSLCQFFNFFMFLLINFQINFSCIFFLLFRTLTNFFQDFIFLIPLHLSIIFLIIILLSFTLS